MDKAAGTSKSSSDSHSHDGLSLPPHQDVVCRPEPRQLSHSLNVLSWPPSSIHLASVTYHWPLTYMSKLLDENCVSEIFTAAGFRWRLKFSPKGSAKNKTSSELFSSFFLESIEAGEGRGPHATFSLGIMNQDFPEQSYWRACQHAFNKKVADWGFSKFMALDDLIDGKRGFVVDDRLVLAVRF